MSLCKTVVVICGSTGVGKTALSLALSRLFPPAEVISADSMQVYTGLDVISNKATLEERQQVKHHLIDRVTPDTEFGVGQFVRESSQLVCGHYLVNCPEVMFRRFPICMRKIFCQ